MKVLFLFNVFVVATLAIGSDTVCYPDLGCFDKGKPFYDLPDRPISYLPDNREDVRTRFFLNTRSNPVSYDELSTADLSTISGSHFNPGVETKFISHGYMENGLVWWIEDMATEFLNAGDYNVIRVDWGKGSTATYGQATANTRIVGAEISFLIDKLKELYGYTADKVHIIGHSLGSHVAGYAGERQTNPKLARITGMDPAGPYFEGTDIIVRLDPSDASFVDAIHTDTDPFYTIGCGIFEPVGHMDFYANGGTDQPGCDQSLIANIRTSGGIYDGGVQYVACNHVRSYEYFTESINSRCKFTSFECTQYGQDDDGYEDYRNGKCYDNKGVQMGFHSIDSKPPAGVTNVMYFSNTRDEYEYCGKIYAILNIFFQPIYNINNTIYQLCCIYPILNHALCDPYYRQVP
ncbi:pancreatic triacylglycerol lipase-like [Antedon mediterranea]|uniref:pancreatic triacylglycerol lipase-like n=1 Tax=Antedon mediterranea TaxID=105859 RepID=UPI003AF6AA4B